MSANPQSKFALLIFLAALGAQRAHAIQGCELPPGNLGPLTNIIKAAAPDSLVTEAKDPTQANAASTAGLDLKALAAQAEKKDIKTIKIFDKPTSVTCNTVNYKISPEVELKPGEAIYLDVPEAYRDRPVTLALLDHRQDPDLPSNKGFQTGVYSTPPGRTSFQVYSQKKDGSGEWRFYKNPSGGVKGSKFAAPSSSPEHETLFAWYKHGHAEAESEVESRDLLRPSALRMVSVGKNPVLISSVTLQVAAAPADNSQVTVFSPGTEFGEPVTEKGQKFGGGQSQYGHFPSAVALGSGYGSSSSSAPKLPEGWKKQGNQLTIPVEAGVNLSNVEIAAGDSHPDYDPKNPNSKPNEDGGYGTSGWSKMSIYLERADGTKDVIVKRENVPPQGIISGMPSQCDYVTKPGDKIVVEADNDTSYVMGVRIGTRKPANK